MSHLHKQTYGRMDKKADRSDPYSQPAHAWQLKYPMSKPCHEHCGHMITAQMFWNANKVHPHTECYIRTNVMFVHMVFNILDCTYKLNITCL